MAYDPIFSASRSRSRNVQRKNDRKMRLKDVKIWLAKTTKLHVRETIDLRKVHSEIVRFELCSQCSINHPEYCESQTDQNHMYYCQFLSKEYDAYVRIYLPSRRTNSPHHRENIANRLEELIRAEPGIRRTRIREMIPGKWEVILDILENDLVFQHRVKKKKKMEKGRLVFLYYIEESPVIVPDFNDTKCESAGLPCLS